MFNVSGPSVKELKTCNRCGYLDVCKEIIISDENKIWLCEQCRKHKTYFKNNNVLDFVKEYNPLKEI